MITINWKYDIPGYDWSPMTGYDEAGNRFWMPGNRDTITCTLPDGQQGFGWTAEEAKAVATRNSQVNVLSRAEAVLRDLAEDTEIDDPDPLVLADWVSKIIDILK